MELNNINTLVRVIKSSPEEEAINIINQFRNAVAEQYIESTWKVARRFLSSVLKSRRNRLKRHIVQLDEFSAAIPLLSFQRYFCAIEDKLLEYSNISNKETREAAQDINAMMYQMLDDIKIDRRNLAQKD